MAQAVERRRNAAEAADRTGSASCFSDLLDACERGFHIGSMFCKATTEDLGFLMGIASMARLMPLRVGPICIRWTSLVPPPSGVRVNRQCADGWSRPPTAHPSRRPGSYSQIVDVVPNHR